MKKILVPVVILAISIAGCSTVKTVEQRDPHCKVNANIERNALPQTPNNMSLPNFGQGVIGWATGPEGAEARLKTVEKADIQKFKDKGVTLAMVQEWQAFYENEVKRNPCNPTAPFRAQLMKKIAMLWVD